MNLCEAGSGLSSSVDGKPPPLTRFEIIEIKSETERESLHQKEAGALGWERRVGCKAASQAWLPLDFLVTLSASPLLRSRASSVPHL